MGNLDDRSPLAYGAVAADRPGDAESDPIDSGSAVVACPADYAPVAALQPRPLRLQAMASATSEPIKVYGQKLARYVWDSWRGAQHPVEGD